MLASASRSVGRCVFAKPDTPRAGRNTSALHDANEGAEQVDVFKGSHANRA
jgi:hypothetical protein